jgi:hypothetical protein
MAQFVFLYRRSGRPAASPAQMQATMQRWQAWFKELTEQGHLKERGLPLELTGAVVAGTAKKDITDGPFAEKDLVMGFSLIEARDLAHASQLSTGCPVIQDGGGCVEVRPVMNM